MISELLHLATSKALLLLFLSLAIVVFRFAPERSLRLIVLSYPRSDPRRTELIAELHAVPRPQQPQWVAEQLA